MCPPYSVTGKDARTSNCIVQRVRYFTLLISFVAGELFRIGSTHARCGSASTRLALASSVRGYADSQQASGRVFITNWRLICASGRYQSDLKFAPLISFSDTRRHFLIRKRISHYGIARK